MASWLPAATTSTVPPLQPGAVIKLVSWNLDRVGPAPLCRALVAMSHLQGTFGNDAGPLVVMLQGLHPSSLQGILDHPWVRANFVVSDARPPADFVRLGNPPLSSFRLLLVSKALPAPVCFRVRFENRYYTDLAAADHAVDSGPTKRFIRLCTAGFDHIPWGRPSRRPEPLYSGVAPHRRIGTGPRPGDGRYRGSKHELSG
jgi:hypothetical protein